MIDLHTHSTASDGSDTPEELVQNAVRKGLSGLALTDHDTLSGLPAFLEAASKTSLRAVPGVEISSILFNKEIHILGLMIDPENRLLKEFLERARRERDIRNRTILEKLNAIGYAISMEEVLQCAGGESVGRPHIARVLVEKHYFETLQDAFDRCLKRGTRAYTPRVLAPPDEAIRMIHEARGLAVWAHPVYHSKGERTFVRRYLKRLVPMGLDGIEGYYSLYQLRQHQLLLEMAKEFSIAVSGGSDYHGLNQPGITLGTGGGALNIPDEVLDNLIETQKKRFPPW